MHTGSGPILVLCKGIPVSEELVRRLDELLRGYEPKGLHTPRMFRYAEAASALGVSPQWLKTRVKLNAIPHHRVGTYVRFTAQDIETIRDTMKRGPAAGRDRTRGPSDA
jgi:hypothetical protein